MWGACDIWGLNTAFGKNKSAMYCNFLSKLLWLNKVFYLPSYLPTHPPSYRQVAYLAILITILPKLLFPRCCNQMVSKTVTALIPAMAATFDMYYLRLLVIARFSYFLQELIFNPPPPRPLIPKSSNLCIGVCEHEKNVWSFLIFSCKIKLDVGW